MSTGKCSRYPSDKLCSDEPSSWSSPYPTTGGVSSCSLSFKSPPDTSVEYVDPGWESVTRTIRLFKRIGGCVDHTSKACLLHLKCPLVTFYQETHPCRKSVGKRPGVTVLSILPYLNTGSYLPVSFNSHPMRKDICKPIRLHKHKIRLRARLGRTHRDEWSCAMCGLWALIWPWHDRQALRFPILLHIRRVPLVCGGCIGQPYFSDCQRN